LPANPNRLTAAQKNKKEREELEKKRAKENVMITMLNRLTVM